MVYKSLNTFIDDLFAFVIKMPIMHRIACFRDDLIFFIYLYQKWAYRVDHSRVNEFGQGGGEEEEEEEKEEKKKQGGVSRGDGDVRSVDGEVVTAGMQKSVDAVTNKEE